MPVSLNSCPCSRKSCKNVSNIFCAFFGILSEGMPESFVNACSAGNFNSTLSDF